MGNVSPRPFVLSLLVSKMFVLTSLQCKSEENYKGPRGDDPRLTARAERLPSNTPSQQPVSHADS